MDEWSREGRRARRRRGREAAMEAHQIDELLETIWTLNELGERKAEEILRAAKSQGLERVSPRLVQRGLIRRQDGEITLTEEGERKAREIVRRHRLAERLLTDLFEVEEEYVESSACEFEHILSPEVTDSICTFLGHPPVCPHGKPIPRGPCCDKARRELKPVVLPLHDFDVGVEGRIVFITPRYHGRLDRLGSLGVVPGSVVVLHQKRPSYVLRIGETEIAIDEEIAREIYVKRAK